MSEINELFWIVDGMFPKLDIILSAQDYVWKIKEEIRLILRVSLRHLNPAYTAYSPFVCVGCGIHAIFRVHKVCDWMRVFTSKRNLNTCSALFGYTFAHQIQTEGLTSPDLLLLLLPALPAFPCLGRCFRSFCGAVVMLL